MFPHLRNSSNRVEDGSEAEWDGSGEITEFQAPQYVRIPTEHRQYSTHNQSDKSREYAEKRGIEIIKGARLLAGLR